ncbi:hypothetical protein [Mycobacteroides abscessus]|uniref:hypothetical protein n=1 Tax=Mycobacteroides abscessus TaxID=36809 RepID=UPI0009A6E66F|nr:hypothetical protein [Mycobacteroides abscessus]
MTGDVDQIPAVTTEWFAQSGDVRRATLSILRQRGMWKRTLILTAVVAAIMAAFCIGTGSGWGLGLAVFAGTVLLYEALAVLMCMLAAYRQNRNTLRAGARWGVGSDYSRIRIDTPMSTIVIRRGDVVSARRAGALVVLKVRPKQAIGIPEVLFADPGLAGLVT